MSHAIDETRYEKDGYVVVIKRDYEADSPRVGQDNLGEIVYLEHTDFIAGDRAVSREEMQELEERMTNGEIIAIPIFASSHGPQCSISMCRIPPRPPLGPDISADGYIWISKEAMQEEHVDEDTARRVMQGEVEELAAFFANEVYMGQILKKKVCDKCGHVKFVLIEQFTGFIGEGAEEELKTEIEAFIRNHLEEQR